MAETDGNCNNEMVDDKKRKRVQDDIDGTNDYDEGCGSTEMTEQNHRNNYNSRTRKKRKKNNKHRKQPVKRKRNWIESCSESINRIPADAIAPLTCVITRVELEMTPLLPGLVLKKVTNDGEALDPLSVENDSGANDDGEKEKVPKTSKNNEDSPGAILVATNSAKSQSTSSWKLLTSMKGDDGEDKKIFVAVQKHPSAIGPTKVRIFTTSTESKAVCLFFSLLLSLQRILHSGNKIVRKTTRSTNIITTQTATTAMVSKTLIPKRLSLINSGHRESVSFHDMMRELILVEKMILKCGIL